MAKPQRGWQRVAVVIPKRFGPTERQAIAQEVIDFIVDRTSGGKDINGNSFSGSYSKAYRESLDYKIAGKPKSGRPINLELSGEMINSIQLLNHKSGAINIGYDKADTKLNGKVEGNRLGTYGSKTPDPSRARDFLGISKSDLKRILDRYKGEDSIERATDQLAAASASGDLVDGIEFDPEEDV